MGVGSGQHGVRGRGEQSLTGCGDVMKTPNTYFPVSPELPSTIVVSETELRDV